MSNSQAISNARWVGINQVGRVILQFVSVAVLARLLPPSAYGVMALATVVMNFAGLFRDMGTSAAIIQRKELTPSLLDSIFWMNLCFGLAVGACVALAAPIAAWSFHQPILLGVLLSLAIAFPLTAAGAPLLAFMEREHAFRQIAWIEVSSNCAGLVAAIAAALCGAGVYSFVIQALTSAGISAVQLWRAAPWSPSWRWNISELQSIWKFSSNLVAFNIINYFVRNGDSVLIGRYLGVIELGWYSVANRILLFPLQNLTFVISRALLPVYSRKQDDGAEVGKLYLRTLVMIAAISAPLMFGLWSLRVPFIAVLMGPKWLAVADILAWFAPMGFLQSLNSTTGTILSAIGRTDILRKSGIINTIITVGAFIIGLQYGLMGIVIGYFLATVVVVLLTMHIVLTQVHLSLRNLAAHIWVPTGSALVMAGVVALAENALAPYLPGIVRLIGLGLLGAVSYAAMIRTFNRQLFTDLLRFAKRSPPNASKENLSAG